MAPDWGPGPNPKIQFLKRVSMKGDPPGQGELVGSIPMGRGWGRLDPGSRGPEGTQRAKNSKKLPNITKTSEAKTCRLPLARIERQTDRQTGKQKDSDKQTRHTHVTYWR